ncbi:hypothetical protein BN7_2738 [Wickerhamomyces ciferrii]|uniref:Fe2OG dioxygenase domain-containing protein n=1 Tax=Wickerhamomyces ciferrii (strain ATCC 14091 / BCRC 22168 / CBS 111 / JCM 3599 / NBRC 0793 / NRRL Y-1031 F-60-10) TaxID=1206466 RepID=K0KJQ7_WICCF|nr:uncharacterized protein BN7_2738 [Wickerhamomyces ciferrii]CCH43191.1 hypothetical protein BN7_2738 [Wickerhamomyces ciferrii]
MGKKKVVKVQETKFSFPHDLIIPNRGFLPSPEVVSEDQIITIGKFFTSGYCNALIKSFTNELNLETTPLIKSKDYAVRVNDRALVEDYQSAQNLWSYLYKILLYEYNDETIIDEFQNAKGLNPQLRIYRYHKGHHFGKHYDESVNVKHPQLKGETKWTLLIYLTGDDEFIDGDTIFYDPLSKDNEPISVHPGKGTALLHKHGDDCLLHEAQLVKDGVKWVLRSDVVF